MGSLRRERGARKIRRLQAGRGLETKLLRMNSSNQKLTLRWREFRDRNPQVRIRDAAQELGVSEAELVATSCGGGVIRLAKPDSEKGWGEVIEQLPTLGDAMALTRNEHCVHERHGRYRHVGIYGSMGNVVGRDIDLRFFLSHWHHAFILTEETSHGRRESVQFFDRDGTAVHKVYLQAGSDRAAFAALVERFRSDDQSSEVSVTAYAPREADRPDAEIDVTAFAEGWRGLQDTHEFFGLLKTHVVGRRQALRLIGREFAEPLATDAAEGVLRRASESGTPIMVFVGNPGMIQIHTGPVRRIVPRGEWLNVLDEEFNLHLRQTAVTDAWVVRKPTQNGVVTSVEVFDVAGDLIVQFFGKRKPGEAELEAWREIVGGLGRIA
jgi:putative hemin transport protein